jgi:hypothetical protein
MAKELPVVYNVPDDLKEKIRLQLGYLIKICPGWVNKLFVYFDSSPSEDSKHTMAEMHADYRYRRVYLTIYPKWFWEDDQSRRETVVHEACHVLTAPIANMIEEAVKALCAGDKRMETFFREQWAIANEATTEDMTRAFIECGSWGPVDIETLDLPEEVEAGTKRQTESIKPMRESNGTERNAGDESGRQAPTDSV